MYARVSMLMPGAISTMQELLGVYSMHAVASVAAQHCACFVSFLCVKYSVG